MTIKETIDFQYIDLFNNYFKLNNYSRDNIFTKIPKICLWSQKYEITSGESYSELLKSNIVFLCSLDNLFNFKINSIFELRKYTKYIMEILYSVNSWNFFLTSKNVQLIFSVTIINATNNKFETIYIGRPFFNTNNIYTEGNDNVYEIYNDKMKEINDTYELHLKTYDTYRS